MIQRFSNHIKIKIILSSYRLTQFLTNDCCNICVTECCFVNHCAKNNLGLWRLIKIASLCILVQGRDTKLVVIDFVLSANTSITFLPIITHSFVFLISRHFDNYTEVYN